MVVVDFLIQWWLGIKGSFCKLWLRNCFVDIDKQTVLEFF